LAVPDYDAFSPGGVHGFDVEKIAKFADKIGTLSFSLMYPRGERDFKADHSYLSRGFLLATTREDKAGASRLTVRDIG
jgi:hypothetical protein